MRLEREEGLNRMRERLEAAGLNATGFHDPSSLQKYELEYMRQAGTLKTLMTNVKQRAAELIEQHKKLTVVSKP